MKPMFKIKMLAIGAAIEKNKQESTTGEPIDTINIIYIPIKTILKFEVDGYAFHRTKEQLNRVDFTIHQKGEKPVTYQSTRKSVEKYLKQICAYYERQTKKDEKDEKLLKAVQDLTDAIKYSPPTVEGGSEYQKTKANFEDVVASQGEK